MSGSQSTLEALRSALAKAADPSELSKTATFVQPGSATVGLQLYDLEAPAKNLYPVLTPLRNRIPRVGAPGGIQANWKGVTGIDTGTIFPGVSEGHRGAIISVGTKEYFAAYRTLGTESAVTYEAELAAGDFDNLRARASQSALQALMIAEEKVILGGNTSYPLGTTPTPTATNATTGGAISGSTTLSIICVALTLDGKARASVANGVIAAGTRTTADGYSETYAGGAAQKSAALAFSVPSGTNTNVVTASVTPVRGAFGYAWFWGTSGSETLGAITTIAQVAIAAAATGSQLASALPSSDNSASSFVFDGLLSMAAASTNNGYYLAAANGSGLTGDATGGISEFDVALQSFWDNYRLSPDRIIVSSQEMLYIRKKILAGNASTSSTRFTFNVANGQIVGGSMPKGYLNPFSMGGGPAEIAIELHPYMPAGTVLFVTDQLPYPMSNVSNVMQIRARRDYYQIDWPQKTRQYEYGVYTDEVLQHYFTPSLGIITNLSAA